MGVQQGSEVCLWEQVMLVYLEYVVQLVLEMVRTTFTVYTRKVLDYDISKGIIKNVNRSKLRDSTGKRHVL